MVCAIGESSCAAAMTHKWHPYKDGVLFESRFWIGFRMDQETGKIVKAIPDGVSIPPIVPKALFGHNIKEFTNLASIFLIFLSVYHYQMQAFFLNTLF